MEYYFPIHIDEIKMLIYMPMSNCSQLGNFHQQSMQQFTIPSMFIYKSANGKDCN